MAKSRRGGRDTPSPSLSFGLPRPISHSSSPSYSLLTEIEDRRTYHPDGPNRPVLLDTGHQHHTLQYPSPKKTRLNKDRFANLRGFPSPRVQFANSEHLVLCIRRKRRKEVLFAKKKTGRGKGKQRRPRRSRYSSISC